MQFLVEIYAAVEMCCFVHQYVYANVLSSFLAARCSATDVNWVIITPQIGRANEQCLLIGCLQYWVDPLWGAPPLHSRPRALLLHFLSVCLLCRHLPILDNFVHRKQTIEHTKNQIKQYLETRVKEYRRHILVKYKWLTKSIVTQSIIIRNFLLRCAIARGSSLLHRYC